MTSAATVAHAQDQEPVARVASIDDSAAPPLTEPPPPSLKNIDAPPPPPPAIDQAPKAKPPPYSIPWQLRPALAPTGLRFDNTVASYEDVNGRHGETIASSLTGSVKIPGTGPEGPNGLAILARYMMVDDTPPQEQEQVSGRLSVMNPLIGTAYALKHSSSVRSNFFLGFTVPVGMGGGNRPDQASLNARAKGASARAAMDNALFAVNDFTVIPGASLAFVKSGFTAQIEATLFHLTRVRGENVQYEASKTNFTSGVHVGYFFASFLSFGSDLRYQRWINAPFAVENDKTGAAKDNLTVAFGPRFHLNAGPLWIRPGVAYWRGLDKPLASSTPNYNSVQIDVPVLF